MSRAVHGFLLGFEDECREDDADLDFYNLGRRLRKAYLRKTI